MTRETFIQIIRTMIREAADETALKAKALYPDWATDKAYIAGDRVLYGGTLYKCLQSHYSIASWTPADAPSLWAEVLIPDPEVIPDWVQPESTNPYMKGDKVKHVGKIWVSLIDGNVWEPGTVGTEALWQEVQS